MKLTDHFKTFMTDVVDLNKTRIDYLERSIEAIKTAVNNSSWTPKIRGYTAHGSWAHKTIIKPQPDDEFDADLIVYVNPVEGWEAKDYVNTLGTALEANGTYADKVRRYAYCITIEYAGERRIDIAPCVWERVRTGEYEVCNRSTNEFQRSVPQTYTKWVTDKNSIVGGNDLKKVTRLLKYMRDIKGNFTCPSFLLTTLVGMQIYDSDKDSDSLADLPTALKTIVGRLDAWLQARPTVPEVRNPVLNSEVQSDVWNQTKYSNFREKINLYRGWIDDAFAETDRDESIAKWQLVFGDDFAAREAKAAGRISEAVDKSTGQMVVSGAYKDLVEKVKALGSRALPADITKLPYIHLPRWKNASGAPVGVRVFAELFSEKDGFSLGGTQSLAPLTKGRWIRFTAANSVGLPYPSGEYKIKWRITNTDEDAFNASALRGDFYDSDTGSSRAEGLQYRGVHFVEAFLLRKSDFRIVGKSDPFYVVVE